MGLLDDITKVECPILSIPPSLIKEESYLQTFLHTLKPTIINHENTKSYFHPWQIVGVKYVTIIYNRRLLLQICHRSLKRVSIFDGLIIFAYRNGGMDNINI